MSALDALHPAIRTWFERRFSLGPTEPQEGGWPEIAAGRDTLIAAPTGSGKTLSAFLTCIDRLYRDAERGALPTTTDVVYVSPLKALAVDVRENLVKPLEEIRKVAYELGHVAPEIRVETRSGDTPASRRAAMVKKPPHILVTTPESLYLMLTAEKSRETLRRTRTVIVDEIHAVARDKRGSHLSLKSEAKNSPREENRQSRLAQKHLTASSRRFPASQKPPLGRRFTCPKYGRERPGEWMDRETLLLGGCRKRRFVDFLTFKVADWNLVSVT